MTKAEFIQHFKAMYRLGNRSDTPPDEHEDWTQPVMAGGACCCLLDQMSRELVKCGVLSQEERDQIYNDL